MSKIIVDYQEISNINQKFDKAFIGLKETYKKSNIYFENIKNSEMSGMTYDTLVKICDKWMDINKKRELEIEEINNLFTSVMNDYLNTIDEINNIVRK